MISIMLILGLTASMSAAKTPPGLTQQDCWSIFPNATAFERTETLASGVLYAKALRGEPGETSETPDQFLGYVFLKSLQHEGGAIDVLVGTTHAGAIVRIRVKGIVIEEEFLAQFQGKTSRDTFEIARVPEDLLFVPVKIKALKTNPALSESIVHRVKEILLAADKVTK